MKLSVNEAKLTGFWTRNCANIQQVFAFGPEKFSGLSPGNFSGPKSNIQIEI